MKITKQQLRRIIAEEKARINEVEFHDGSGSGMRPVRPHYAHGDIKGELLEVLKVWQDASSEQLRMAFEDALKDMP